MKRYIFRQRLACRARAVDLTKRDAASQNINQRGLRANRCEKQRKMQAVATSAAELDRLPFREEHCYHQGVGRIRRHCVSTALDSRITTTLQYWRL